MGAVISTLSNPISVDEVMPPTFGGEIWASSPEEQTSLFSEELIENLVAGAHRLHFEEEEVGEISEEDYIAEDEDEHEL